MTDLYIKDKLSSIPVNLRFPILIMKEVDNLRVGDTRTYTSI